MDAVVVVADAMDFWEASSGSVVGEEGTIEEAVGAAAAAGFAVDGEEKKEVMVALAFGFLAAEVAMSPALRLRGVAMTRQMVASIDSSNGGSTGWEAVCFMLRPEGPSTALRGPSALYLGYVTRRTR